jgi:hypothetical protein
MRTLLLSLMLALSATACAIPRSGYIYSPNVGGRGSVMFPDSNDNSGVVRATLTSGESCAGRYSTIPGPRVTWDEEKIDTIESEDTQNGMALLQCSSGHVLRCTFTRDLSGDGMGRCLDNHQEWLTMYF